MPRNRQTCHWADCRRVFNDPEALLEHLSDDHVGRRSTNNLCLECKWNDCGATAAKRDHLVSHLKVHLPFKPYACSVCKKPFKRPQDLKKHEKTHTIEHKASLMSNQPGYKAVRRRCKPVDPEQTAKPVATSVLQTSRTSKPFSDHTSETVSHQLADTSFSTPLSNAKSGGSSSYHPSTDSDVECKQEHPCPKYEANIAEHDSNPINELIHDVVKNKMLSPEYDIAMMNRLNEISDALEEQETDWTPSIESQSEIDILQNWFEQLSSNIQSGGPAYPPLEMDPITASTSSHADYALYPNSGLYGGAPIDDLSHLRTSDNPLAASLLCQHLLSTQSLRQSSSSSTGTTTAALKTTQSPSFWNPGKQTVHIDVEPIDGPAPSDPVDFAKQSRICSEVQPIHLFETRKVQPQQSPTDEKETKDVYADKRNLVHLSNVFASSDGERPVRNTKAPSNTKYSDSEDDIQDDDGSFLIHDKNKHTDSDTPNIPDIDAENDTQDNTSPYANLVNQLSELFKENGDSWQQAQRQRHLQAIDELWDALARSRKARIAKRVLKQDSYFNNISTISSPVVSVE